MCLNLYWKILVILARF